MVPWLENNIKKGEQLQGAYEQNPFNVLQQTAYQNAFSDADNFRSSFMPALMQHASGLLGSNFQMPQAYSAAAQGAPAPGLMTTSAGQGQAPAQGQPTARPSAMYGNIDWQSLNPYTNGAIPAAPAQSAETEQERRQKEQEEALKMFMDNGQFGGA